MPSQFFHSNVAIEQEHQGYLERPRLDRLLEQAMQNRIVMVIAGAGYGKTQAVYSFLRKYNMMTAWLQLSNEDNYPWRFWEDFIQPAAFSKDDVFYKLAHTGFPETKRQFDRYLVIPQTAVEPDRQYIFVYDDFHLIHDKNVLRFMSQSISTSFPNITSVIISRTEPTLDLKAQEDQGFVSRITEDDLRFSQEELVDYYEMLHIQPKPGGLADLYRVTEGWAFAIHLVGLSRKSGSGATDYGLAFLRSNVFSLIESEVFSAASPELQHFLIKLSLIEHYPPELLAELTPDPGLIKEMEQTGSFIHFDTYLNEYRLHHLFLEFLSNKQGSLGAEEKKEVYIKAARWCTGHNMRLTAVTYFEKAGVYDELFETLYTLPLIVQDHIAQFILDILDRAPPETYRQSPVAWIFHSRMLFTLGRFDEALAEILKVIAEYEALPPSAFSDRLLSGCYKNLGFISLITCIHTGRYDFAHYFERGHYYYCRNPFEILSLSIAGIGSYVCRVGNPEKGEMERFIEATVEALPYLTASMGGCYYGMDDLARAELDYFRGNLTKAEKFARIALAKSREQSQYEIENRALFYLLKINVAWGNHEEIRELLKSLEAQLSITEYVNRQIYYDIITGWFYIHTGQAAKLVSWLKNDFEASELNSLIHGQETLVRIQWQMSEKRYPIALASLGNRENNYNQGALLLGKITMKVLEAICLKEIGENSGALAALTEAYALAEPNALDMCFIEIGKDVRTLMEMALREKDCTIPQPWLEKIRRGASAYAQRIFGITQLFRDQRHSPQPSGLGLSHREMGVLTGLSQGLTREEIAGDHVISINTVKSVIRSVYNKLGAVNRADAVRIAIAKGILKNNA
jgi:LuxR family maltose regulon positive regulatory protein